MQSRAITGRMNYETNEVDAIIRTGCCHKLEGRSTMKDKNKIRNNLLKTENPTSNRLKNKLVCDMVQPNPFDPSSPHLPAGRTEPSAEGNSRTAIILKRHKESSAFSDLPCLEPFLGKSGTPEGGIDRGTKRTNRCRDERG